MTLENQSLEPTSYDLDGSTRTWPVPFRLLEARDLRAIIAASNGAETLLELDNDYTVAGAGEPAAEQATITLATAAGTSGKRLVLAPFLELDQPLDLDDGTALPAEALEQEYDRVVMQIRQQAEGLERALQLPLSSPVRNIALPSPAPNLYLGWNAAGTALENKHLVDTGIDPPDSTATIQFPEDIGLRTDGTVNNSTQINAFMRQLSDDGGGTILLQAPKGDGGTYHFPDDVLQPSFVSVGVQSPCTLGQKATWKIAGDKKAAFTGLRLAASAAQGATSILVDTASLGGGPVSGYLTVGKPIQIGDDFDPSGNPRLQESNVVATINDATRAVGLVDGLDHAYAVASARVTVDVAVRLAANTTLLSNVVTVNPADLGLVGLYDWVLLEDDRQTNGVTTWMEIRQVVGIGVDGPEAVTLNGKVRRVYLVAQHARLTVLDPVRRAMLTGLAPGRIVGPAGGRYTHTVEVRYGLDCVTLDCHEPNSGPFGTDGNAFRLHKSYNCFHVRPNARNAKHVDDGEGNGCVIAYSTRCGTYDPTMSGMRHPFQFVASTECTHLNVDSTDNLLSDIDFHGLNSVACGVSLRRISYGNRTASASNVGIACGNPTHQDGDHDCWVVGGEGGIVGPMDIGVRMYPPSTNFSVIGINGQDLRVFLLHQDTAGSNLVANGLNIIDCNVDRCSDRLFDLRGGANGSAAKTLTGLVVRNFRGAGLTVGMRMEQIGSVVLDDVALQFTNPSAADSYAIHVDNVTSLRAYRPRTKGSSRGVSLKTVDHYFFGALFEDQVATTVRRDQGGAPGEWRMCATKGFTPSYDATGGSVIVDDPSGNIGVVAAAGAITDNSLSLAKLQQVPSNRVLFRTSSGTGNWEATAVGAAVAAVLAGATTPEAWLASLGGAPLVNPTFTGVPTAPTAPPATNSTQLATTAFVEAARVVLTAGAPAGLDTLNELAAAIGDDPAFATTINAALSGKQPSDAMLTALAALVTVADRGLYFTGADAPALYTLTALARTFLGLATVNLQRVALNAGTVALTDAATIATDCSLGQVFTVTLAGNRTLGNPSNVVEGGNYLWRIRQDATGGRTLALGTSFRLRTGGVVAISTGANLTDYLSGFGRTGGQVDVFGFQAGFA